MSRAYHHGMTEEQNRPAGKPGAVGHAVGLASELGISMGLLSAALLLGCLVLGRWLDRALGSGPVMTIILLVVGALTGQVVLYRMATGAVQQLDRGARHILDRAGFRRTIGLAIKALLLATAPALIGAVLGVLLDRLLGTAIILTVLLAMIGFAGGIVVLLKLTRSHAAAPQGDD